MPLVILVNKFRKHCYKLQTCSWRTEHWNVSMTNQHVEKEGKVKFIFWFSFHSNIPNVSRFKQNHLLKVHTIFYLRYYHLIWSAAAAKSPQSCPTVRPHRWQPTRVPHPWDSPGKNNGVGCHFLLQCMKGKSESEVAQSCPTLSNPMGCSHQAPPSMGFSRQEYWSGVPSPSPI